jgi:polyribonucleotide nucleotidyltransferase
VTVASFDAAGAQRALELVESMTAAVQLGKIYQGRVTSIKDFGAFVEILPGKDGLCHISELSEGYVRSVSDILKVGDEIDVKVIAIDEQDRVKLSRKVALRELGKPDELADLAGERPERTERSDRPERSERSRPPRRDYGDRDRDRDRERGRSRS